MSCTVYQIKSDSGVTFGANILFDFVDVPQIMTNLVAQLCKEVDALDKSGSSSLASLMEESNEFLSDLKALENDLQENPEVPDVAARLEKSSSRWYKKSITSLKGYNGQINKFLKNVVHSSKFAVDLDEAYSFPLLINSPPVKEVEPIKKKVITEKELLQVTKLRNRGELMKSIVLHLLKIGHGAAVLDLLSEFDLADEIDPAMLEQFIILNDIVDDIKVKHDLTKVLKWLEQREQLVDLANYEGILFKFHMLQFALLLAGDSVSDSSFHIDSALAAYSYAKTNFVKFFKDYVNEISPVITLLLFKSTDDPAHIQENFKTRIIQTFDKYREKDKRHAKEAHFIADILSCFDKLHSNQLLFSTLANEFVAQYCGDMSLSSESSLFQTMLAGFINLPNFYKYTKLQRRLSRTKDETTPQVKVDLPFQLPDKNQFLFNYHPIFICPVSKEQLVPITTRAKITEDDMRDRKKKPIIVSGTDKLVAMTNPVVVFDHCRHLALKDSVRHLSKGGSEVFKCHYCYKKHKLLDVSDAYFIDL